MTLKRSNLTNTAIFIVFFDSGLNLSLTVHYHFCATFVSFVGFYPVIVVAGEQVTVARARELRQSGLSMRKIAAKLTDEGHKTKRGGRWQAETISKILKTRYIEQISN